MLSLPRAYTGRSARGLFMLLSVLLLAAVARATIGAAYQMQLGNPSSATNDPNNHSHYLVVRDQYAMDYNNTTRGPNWVSWDLTSTDIGGSGRSPFLVDTTLPAAFYQVQTWDYSGSGYDRGHMCPSADRTVTVADNQVTFYMSNMVPQSPDNNQGVWANFEGYCRTLAQAGNEILIVCGPGGFNGSMIASGVAVPSYTWKVVVVVPLGAGMATERITPTTRVIAIKVPNAPGVRSTPWQNFVTSVAQLELDTGLTFFTALPPATANALRLQVDGQTAVGAPSIIVHPGNQTTVVGGTATFAVTAGGDAPLTYQWLKDDNEVPGATDASLTISPVGAGDVGGYQVVVANPVGTVTSNAGTLTVLGLPPTITTSPSSQTVGAGTTVTLAVTATGSPTLSYQWRLEGVTLSGATTATLTVPNAQADDAGEYDVVVTNSVDAATSAPAILVVNPAPPSIVGQPAPQNAVLGGSASFMVRAVGTEPLTYQWRKAGVPLTDGGNISGATTATLVVSNIAAIDAGNYDVVVANALDDATSQAAALSISAPPPTVVRWDFGTSSAPNASPSSGLPADITGGALSQGNNNGATVLLTTTSASGSYSGASGGMNAGAAARTGALNQAGGGSAYFEFTLAPVAGKRLSVTAIAFGMRSTSTGPQAFSIFSSLDGFAVPLATGGVPNNSNWASYAPTLAEVLGATAEPITFRIYGHNGTGSASANTANWRLDDLRVTATTVFPPPTAPVVVASTPAHGTTDVDVATPITVTFNEAVSFTGSWFTIASATHGPIAAAVSGGPTTFALTPPSALAYSDTVTVTVNLANVVDQATGTIRGAGTTSFTFTTGSYVPPTPPLVTTQPLPQSVIVGGNATFTVAATGTAPLSYVWRHAGAPIGGNPSAFTPTLVISNATTADAGAYDCVVSNIAGSDVSNPATLSVSLVPAAITAGPTAQHATRGGDATFTVTASGTPPLTYQWRYNGAALSDGAGVAGAASPSLTLSSLTPDLNGVYDVVVTNGAGSVTSAGAALAVVDAAGVVTWNFVTAAPTSGVPEGIAGGTVSQGNNNGSTALITSVSVSSGYVGASGAGNAGAAARTGALNQGAGGSAYFEFTFTPAGGRSFAATGISFGLRSTGTGPQAYALYSSVDGFAAPLATGVVANNSNWSLHAPRFAGVTGAAGAPVTVGSPGTELEFAL